MRLKAHMKCAFTSCDSPPRQTGPPDGPLGQPGRRRPSYEAACGWWSPTGATTALGAPPPHERATDSKSRSISGAHRVKPFDQNLYLRKAAAARVRPHTVSPRQEGLGAVLVWEGAAGTSGS